MPMSEQLHLLNPNEKSQIDLAQEILALETPPSPEDATACLFALASTDEGFNSNNPVVFQAAAKCLQWGASHHLTTVEDLMLTPFTAIESTATIGDAQGFFELGGSNVILLTHQGQWVGVIDRTTTYKAINQGLGSESVRLLSSGKPPRLQVGSTITQARRIFSSHHHPVILITQTNRAVGLLDREVFSTTAQPNTLPQGWELMLGTRLKWLKAVDSQPNLVVRRLTW